jgi:hypothetical protein
MRARHRSPGFATETRLPTLLHRSRMLSHGAARPIDVCRRLFTRGRERPRAACRLLQPNRSASTTRNESTEPRAPYRWSPTCTALPAGGYAGSEDGLPFGRCLRSAASREATGQGPRSGCSRIRFAQLPPSRSLATGASPQPDRLGHLLSQARDVAGWSSSAPSGRRVSASHLFRVCPTISAYAAIASQGHFLRGSAKSHAFSGTRGAFHRRIRPVRG